MDYIKREDAINALWKALYEYEDKTEKQFINSDKLTIDDWMIHRIYVQRMSGIDIDVIRNLPAADVVERNALQHSQHVESVKNALDVPERNVGKWEIIDEVEPRRYGCSNCKRMVWHTENFCPNCGAKME